MGPSVLQGLAPAAVFTVFAQLCAIPHGSGNTEKITAYCLAYARRLGLACESDRFGNVIIRKSASPGRGDRPPVILQGHLDMVCEQEADCRKDMTEEGLDLFVDGDLIGAHGTTLGGDDGIAVAMALAILADDTLPHPPLEVLFTTDEETGMDGAQGLDVSRLTGCTLINMDSEAEGVLTVGCAGGARAELGLDLTPQPAAGDAVTVTVDGLIGGHSGTEIDKGRQNANILLGRLLGTLPEGYRLVSLCGGQKDNAIPRRAVCCLIPAPGTDVSAAAAAFAKENLVAVDPGLTVTVEAAKTPAAALTAADSRRVAELLCAAPNGVQAMSTDIPGLVQTSLNLGVLRLADGAFRATFSVRSSKTAEKAALLDTLSGIAKRFGGVCTTHGHYPAWEYRPQSHLRDTMVRVFTDLYGHPPVVETIHAGLECGLFSDRMPGLDAVSLGPDMQAIHTPGERLSISSTARTYDYVCRVLAEL